MIQLHGVNRVSKSCGIRRINKSQSSHVIVATKHVAYIVSSEAAVKSYLEKLNLYKIVSVNK